MAFDARSLKTLFFAHLCRLRRATRATVTTARSTGRQFVRRLMVRDKQLAAINAHIAIRQFAEAEVECRTVLALADRPKVSERLGYIYQQTGRDVLAIEACQAAIEGGVKQWGNYLTLGRSFRATGQHAEAMSALATAHRLAPSRIDIASLLLEETYLACGRGEAEEIYYNIAKGIKGRPLKDVWNKILFENGNEIIRDSGRYFACAQLTARAWAVANRITISDVEGIDEIPVESPPIVGAPPLVHFKTSLLSNAPYVAELKDVAIFSSSDIVLTRDNFALNETGAHAKYGHLVSHQSDQAVIGQRGNCLLLGVETAELQTLDIGIMLSGAASSHFGHWVPEYLPKLQFAEHHPQFKELPIIVDEQMPQSHFDYLRCITDNPLIQIPPGGGFRCERLVYAPPATFFPIHLFPNDIPPHEVGPVSPRSYRYLKSRVEAALGTRKPGGGKYFLSRRNMNWRRLGNDEEISDFLGRRGYETVLVETLSFMEQVRLFQNASHIVAPNGSALQSIIFSDPAVKLVVLSQQNLVNWAAFYAQTKALGYHSLVACGESTGDPQEKHRDYVVPIKTLELALEQVG